MKRADQLDGCAEGSPEEAELMAIADAVEAYERRRWPEGKAPRGKGTHTTAQRVSATRLHDG